MLSTLTLLVFIHCDGMGALEYPNALGFWLLWMDGRCEVVKTKWIEPPRSVPKRSRVMGWVLLSTLTLLGVRSCDGLGALEYPNPLGF
jgi:hypothetical protein